MRVVHVGYRIRRTTVQSRKTLATAVTQQQLVAPAIVPTPATTNAVIMTDIAVDQRGERAGHAPQDVGQYIFFTRP